MDLRRIVFSKAEKEELTAKIKQKRPFDEILNRIRDNDSPNKFKKLHLLTRKYLLNIKAMYNLHNDSVRHQNDYTSVKAWIEKIKIKHYDSIVR